MNVPLMKKAVVLGGAIAPLRKPPQNENSVAGKGANQIVGVHAPAPMVGGDILDKLKFSERGKTSKRDNIKFIF